MSLGRKQNIKNDAWLNAVANIEESVSREELDALTVDTVKDIKERLPGRTPPMRGALVRTVLSLANSARWQASPPA